MRMNDDRKPYPDLLVLLPGITGSELANEEGVIWGWNGRTLLKNLLSAGDRLKRDLRVTNDSPTAPTLDDGVRATRLLPDIHLFPGLWKIDGYGVIQKQLGAGVESFEVNRHNFLPFPYDWRRDNRAAAHRLREVALAKLETWREKSNNKSARLILIAHSMGGLISRYFLEVLEGWRETRALITFGTPYSGSLNAVDSLVNGNKKFGLDLTDTCRSMISLHQLLPTFACCDTGNGRLQSLAEMNLPGVDPGHHANARNFHEEIRLAAKRNADDEDYRRAKYGIFPIVGFNQPTRNSFRLAGDIVELTESRGLDDPTGDGTVPRHSAAPDETTLVQSMFASARHAELQNHESALKHLDGLLGTLAVFRGPSRGAVMRPVNVSLDLEDIHLASQPIVVRARPTRETKLLLTVTDRERWTTVIDKRLQPDGTGWQSATFELKAGGVYTVEVSGDKHVEQVRDVIEVIDREAA